MLTSASQEDAIERLVAAGFCRDGAEDVLAIVAMGRERAALYSGGMRPSQFHGDFENDALFKAAIDSGCETLGIRRPRRWDSPWIAIAFAVVFLGLVLLRVLTS